MEFAGKTLDMLTKEEISCLIQFLNSCPAPFFETLDSREQLVWQIYKDLSGDTEQVGRTLGISKSYVSRFIKRIHYKLKQVEESGDSIVGDIYRTPHLLT